jgi:hypothetical protein
MHCITLVEYLRITCVYPSSGMNVPNIHRVVLQDLMVNHTIALRYRRVARWDVSVDSFGWYAVGSKPTSR